LPPLSRDDLASYAAKIQVPDEGERARYDRAIVIATERLRERALLGQPSILEQRVDARIPPAKLAIARGQVVAVASARQHQIAEPLAIGSR
jgi:hypothetical protein